MVDYSEPALYCGTYGKYNNGSIAGKWLKLGDYADAEEFLKACAELHADEPDAEFMFQDFENLPREFYGESLGTKDLERIYEWLEYDETEREYIAEYLDEVDGSAEASDIVDRYYGNINDQKGDNSFMSDEEAYGYYCAENGLIEIPEHVYSYFDFESYGRDMLQDKSITESGHIFTNN